jgi:hypothetical protein
MNRWVNFLSLIPGTTLTLLVISIAFLRFYDETDFTILGQLANPRIWSNRLAVAAILVALVNFGVEWDRRNQEADCLAKTEQRRLEEAERATRRDRIQAERDLALLNYLIDPSERNRNTMDLVMVVLQDYRDTLL